MSSSDEVAWADRLDAWLAPFLSALPRRAQRRWAPVYVRGLLLPGERPRSRLRGCALRDGSLRDSVEPMAGRVCPGAVEQLHHFVAASPWANSALERVLAERADALVGGPDAVLIVDDTALVKQGRHSVGVQRQYCGQLGKRANCQALVSLTLARGEVPVPVALRLFLPDAPRERPSAFPPWRDGSPSAMAKDAERRKRAGVPEAVQGRPKWHVALDEIDRLRQAGVRFGCVLGDAEYGKVAAFRHALDERGLRWALGIPPNQKLFDALGGPLSAWLQRAGLSPGVAGPLGLGLVIGVITYLSIVVGELVPKRFALRAPEAIVCLVAPAMTLLSRVAAPLVWLLDASTGAVFRLLRVGPERPAVVIDEEIRSVVADAESGGTIEPAERRLISGVMRLGDRPVRGVMTPRTGVDWIDPLAGEDKLRETLLATSHSRLPMCEGSVDAMLGAVQTRELLAALVAGRPLDVRAHARPAPVMADTADALDALAVLRDAEVPMALVHDEYGHFQGVVTPADVLEAIAGAFRADADTAEPGAVRREDGSWLLAGWLPADEMAEHLGVKLPPERDYQTAAGYVLAASGRLPATGDRVEVGAWRFEVVDLDGNRIDEFIAAPASAATDGVLGLHRAVEVPKGRT